MKEFCFLDVDELLLNPKINVFKDIGKEAELIDFSVALGGRIYKRELDKNIGGYWLNGKCLYDGEVDVILGSNLDKEKNTSNFIGIRPALKFEYFDNIRVDGEKIEVKKENKFYECEYGFYPQNVVSKELNILLEKGYKKGLLEESKKSYTLYWGDNIKCKEYKCNDKKYIRIYCNLSKGLDKVKLSNGEYYKNNDVVWIEVKPIKWWVDLNCKKMFTDKIIYAGSKYTNERLHHNNEDFENSEINIFMNNYFSKEIV